MRADDTHVLARLLEQDAPVQAEAAEAYRQSGGPLWISHIVLVETVWVLTSSFNRTRKELLAMLDALVKNRDFHLQDEGVVAAAVALFRTSKADFSDCLGLETARAHGHLPLATFERNLGRLPGALHPRR